MTSTSLDSDAEGKISLRLEFPSSCCCTTTPQSGDEKELRTIYAVKHVDRKVLVDSSSYFESLLSGKMGDGIPALDQVENKPATLFPIVLENRNQAMRCSELLERLGDDIKTQRVRLGGYPIKDLFQLAILTDRFIMESHLENIMASLSTRLSPRTTHHYFMSPETFRLGPGQLLMDKVRQMAIVGFDVVRGFGQADADTVRTILERPETKGHENEIYEAFVDWTQTANLPREQVQGLCAFIRAENMTKHNAIFVHQAADRCKCQFRPTRPARPGDFPDFGRTKMLIGIIPLDDILTAERMRRVNLASSWVDGCCITLRYGVTEGISPVLEIGIAGHSRELDVGDIKVRSRLFANFSDSPENKGKIQTRQLESDSIDTLTATVYGSVWMNPFRMTLDELAISKYVVDGMISVYAEVEVAI